MTPEERKRLELLEHLVAELIKPHTAYITLPKQLVLSDGAHMTFGTGTGTKIGTAATEKLGFYGATPVVQQAAPEVNAGAGDSDGHARAKIIEVIEALQTIGLLAT